MTVISLNAAKKSNRSPSNLSSDQEGVLPGISATALVMRAAQTLWPTKPDIALADKTGRSDRLCRYWLESKYRLSSDDLVALLRTDEGFHILEAVMGDAKPLWWRDFKRSVKRAELRREQKRIQMALDADEQTELGI
jgi:hypothetical protein